MRLVFGEATGGKSARGEAFLAMCQKAGFDATHSDKIMVELWMKFILLASNASITAATRKPIGMLRDDPDTNALFGLCYAEVAAVGRARGIALSDDAVERTLGFNRNAPPTMMASMAHDLIRGNRIELPWLGGKVVALGKELGVPTPVHEILYAVLKLHSVPAVSG
jgi:2-dehydropantoate 2-reductase